MDTKEVKLECPCCQSRLEVDVRTATVLRWRPKDEGGGKDKPSEEGGGSAADKVSRRLGDAGDKFDDSLSRERRREADLDDLFRKANQKLQGGNDD